LDKLDPGIASGVFASESPEPAAKMTDFRALATRYVLGDDEVGISHTAAEAAQGESPVLLKEECGQIPL